MPISEYVPLFLTQALNKRDLQWKGMNKSNVSNLIQISGHTQTHTHTHTHTHLAYIADQKCLAEGASNSEVKNMRI